MCNHNNTEHHHLAQALRESQQNLQSLFDNLVDMLFVFTKEGMLLHTSPSVEQRLGYTADELRRMHILAFHAEEQREAAAAVFAAIIAQETDLCTIPLITKERKIIPIETHVTKGMWNGQEVFFGIARDITERQQLEEIRLRSYEQLEQRVQERTEQLSTLINELHQEIELREKTESILRRSETRYREIIDLISDLVYSVRFLNDGTPELEWGFHGIERLTGYTEHEVTFQNWTNLIIPDDTLAVTHHLARLMGGQFSEVDFRIRTKQGEVRWLHEHTRPEWNSTKQRVVRIYGSITDITEQKQAEEALRASEARIREHAARVESLIRIAARLNSQLDLKTLLKTICIETRNALRIDMVMIFLYNQQQEAMVFANESGVPVEALPLIAPVPVRVFDLTMPVSASVDGDFDPHDPNSALQATIDVRSRIHALVKRDQEVLGYIVGLVVGTPRNFTDDELLLIGGIADQAAQAIVNAQLFANVQEERALLSQRVAERTADLSRTNAELARAMRAKDDFLANMSHELRTPLNAVLGLSESLQECTYGPINDQQRHALATIEQCGRHLLSLINDMLDLAKIESGQIKLEPMFISLESLCQTSLQFVRQQALKKNISLAFDVYCSGKTPRESNNLQVMMYGDGRRLKQILINLLINAVKFTPAQGQVGLEVIIDEISQKIQLTVWDTGIGISPEDQQRLFRPFIQVDRSLSREHEGTGLGLALVLRLTELHGGSVSLESTVGQGSRFTVSLPYVSNMKQSSDTQKQLPDGPSIGALPTLGIPSRSHSQSPLILLAEDNEANISSISDFLALKNYCVIVARNGMEAIAQTEEQSPALILMDIQMPKLDGLETIRRIRADTRFSHVPIIALTALTMQGDRERCLAAGADEYMSKPVCLRELHEMIQSLLANCDRNIKDCMK